MPPGTRYWPFGRENSLCPRASAARHRLGLPVATCIVRTLAEIGQNNSHCLANFLLQHSRGAARHAKTGLFSARLRWRRPRFSAPRSLSARLGDSFYFAKCEIVESLLRRGALVELSRRAGTALRPRRPRLRRGGGAFRHPVLAIRARKQSLAARLEKFFRFNSSLKRCISLLRRARGCRSALESWSWLGN